MKIGSAVRIQLRSLGPDKLALLSSLSFFCLAPAEALAAERDLAFGSDCRAQQIAGGQVQSSASGSDGSVASWGASGFGVLGTGNTEVAWGIRPSRVSSLSGSSRIVSGRYHTLAAVPGSETLWVWGFNRYGQIGNGSNVDALVPTAVTFPLPIDDIAAGGWNSMAIDSAGTVWTWGDNADGQLGDGTTVDSSVPIAATGLLARSGCIRHHALVVKADGTVWAWGSNWFGELGNGTTTSSLTPIQCNSLSTATKVACGDAFSLALLSDNSVWSWGNNNDGELGIGSMAPAEVKPVKIQSLANVVAISAGLAHGLALRNDGTVWAWGYNGNGQLGDGTTVTRRSPVQVIGLGTATAIAAGENHSLAILVDGSIWAWGSNGFGQLGNGESGGGADRDTPILVDLDRTPDDQGSDTLRAVKTSNGADVYLDFAGAVAGGWRMFADADRTQIGVTALTPDAVERSFLDSGAIAIPGIRYYALRGLSLCSLTPGP